MENATNPPVVLSVGALSVSIISAIYLNNKVNELNEILNKSDKKLAKLIKTIDKDSTIDEIKSIRKDVDRQKRIGDQLKKSVNELHDLSFELDKTNRKLDHVMDFLYDKHKYTYDDPDSDSYTYTKSPNNYQYNSRSPRGFRRGDRSESRSPRNPKRRGRSESRSLRKNRSPSSSMSESDEDLIEQMNVV